MIVGNKAYNLHILIKNNIPVPEWFVIPSNYFEYFFKKYFREIKSLIDSEIKEEMVYNEILKIIEGEKDWFLRKISPFEEEIKKLKPVSIRSSGIFEDISGASFAGQFSSFLNINKDFHEYIIKCLASIFNPQNIVYHRKKDIDITKNRIAIIIQKMIDADKSGVIFSSHPETGEDMKIINATYGLGEGVVSGKFETDTYIIYKGGKIEAKIGKKKNIVKLDIINGVKIVNLDNSTSQKPCLNNEEIESLCNVADRIQEIYGYPQDIEFAIKDNNIFILQTRPVTTIKERFIWDNSNIIESFPELTTPLTFSFANEVYSIVYKIVMKSLGVSEKILEEKSYIFKNMIGFINNRIYYSLESWYTTLSFLPAYSSNKRFMEVMMGVKKEYKEKNKIQYTGIKGIYDTLNVILRMLFNFIMHDRNIKKFTKIYNDGMDYFERMLKRNLSLKEYTILFEEMKKRILYRWIAPINNDIFTMIFYGIFKKYISELLKDENTSIYNQLLSKDEDMGSITVGEFLLKIAEEIKKIPEMKKILIEGKKERFFNEIENYEKLDKLFKEYLKKYGYRSCNELKLEVPNIKEEPSKLLNILKNMVEKDVYDKSRKSDIYKSAERTVLRVIYSKPFPFNTFHLIFFKFLLKTTKKMIRFRENQRLARSNIFGCVRELFLKIGEEFEKNRIINKRDDIFFISHNEIFSYIFGTSLNTDLKKLIMLRKKEFEENKNKKLPERFTTFIPPYSILNTLKEKEKIEELRGIGCSSGIVKGKVQIVEDPYKDDIKGDIMVASQTDPGWLPIFTLFKGIIIERGSLLSHSAIVARELGIPAVIGVRNAKMLLKNNDLVEIDGGSGTIKILRG